MYTLEISGWILLNCLFIFKACGLSLCVLYYNNVILVCYPSIHVLGFVVPLGLVFNFPVIPDINGVSTVLLSDLVASYRLLWVPLSVKSLPPVCRATELNPQSGFVVLLQSKHYLLPVCHRTKPHFPFLFLHMCVCAFTIQSVPHLPS